MAAHIKVLINENTLTHVGLFINYKQVRKYTKFIPKSTSGWLVKKI